MEERLNWTIQKLERQAKHGQTPQDLLRLGEAYFQMGYYLGQGATWFEKARAQVDFLLGIEPPLPPDMRMSALVLRGGAHYALGDNRKSEASYRQALELDGTHALALVGLGNLARERKDFPKARAFYDRAAQLQPDLWQAHYNLGLAAHEEAQGMGYDGGERLLERGIFHLVRALEQSPIDSVIPNIYKELGELFLHSKRFDDAKKFFTRLTKHERYAPLAYYYLGLTNFALQKYNSAIQSFRRYLKMEPKSALAHAKIGLAYLELGEHSRAREACQRALELDEGNVLALFTLGCSHLDEDDPDSAIELFESLLDATPAYVPAFVELTKAKGLLGELTWLATRFHREVRTFESTPGLDGGRGHYNSERGAFRQRIDILLDRLRELGGGAFEPLMAALAMCQTESLRFQIWEQLYELSLIAAIDELNEALNDPDFTGSPALGERVLDLGAYLDEDVLIRAYDAQEEGIRRVALERLHERDNIGEYKRAISQVRAEHQEFQGAVLRTLSLKGSPRAEAFLAGALESTEHPLRLSAAVALVLYGNKQALQLLEAESERLEGPAKLAMKSLIRTGWERHGERHKVIHLGDLYGDRPALVPQEPQGASKAPKRPSHCAICGRHQREVERMLAGSRLMVCTRCVAETWDTRHRRLHDPTSPEDCDFCQRSIVEVDALYDRPDAKQGPIHICEGCLDLSMGVLRREEVDRFLKDFC